MTFLGERARGEPQRARGEPERGELERGERGERERDELIFIFYLLNENLYEYNIFIFKKKPHFYFSIFFYRFL